MLSLGYLLQTQIYWIDVLLILAGFVTFIVFGFAVWLLKREADRKKQTDNDNGRVR